MRAPRCAAFFLFLPLILNGQSWTRDSSFAVNGLARFAVGRATEQIFGLSAQSDGRLVAAGDFNTGGALLVRYFPDGAVDSSFGQQGKVTFAYYPKPLDPAGGLVVRPDDRLVYVANHNVGAMPSDVLLLGFLPDGAPDPAFGQQGVVTINEPGTSWDVARDVLLDPDGRIVLAGNSASSDVGANNHVVLWRFLPDGTPDSSFGIAGRAKLFFGNRKYQITALARQPDGKLLAAGSRGDTAVVIRFLPSGALDPTFGDQGLRRLRYSWFGVSGDHHFGALEVQPDGRIVAGGWICEQFGLQGALVYRLLENGAPDPAFGSQGVAYRPHPRELGVSDMALLPDGRLLFSCGHEWSEYAALLRLQPGGAPDSTFGAAGWRIDSLQGKRAGFYDLLRTSDGHLLAAGWRGMGLDRDFAVVRYDSSGQRDAAFGLDGMASRDFAVGRDHFTQLYAGPGGTLIAAGRGQTGPQWGDFDRAFLVRLTADGQSDPAFGDNGLRWLDGYALKQLIILPDGKMLAAMQLSYSAYGGHVLARLLPDGRPDSSFAGTGTTGTLGYGWEITRLAVLPDGRMLAGGVVMASDPLMSSVYEFSHAFVTRRLANGVPDSSFGLNGVVEFDVAGTNWFQMLGLLPLPDGKIQFVVQTGALQLVQLLEYGTPDPAFGQNGVVAHGGSQFSGLGLFTRDSEGRLLGAGNVGVVQQQWSLLHPVFARFLPDGTLDATFGANGIVSGTPDSSWLYVGSLHADADGAFHTYGIPSTSGFRVQRALFNANGTLYGRSTWTDQLPGESLGSRWPLELSTGEVVVPANIWGRQNDGAVLRYRFEPGCLPVEITTPAGAVIADVDMAIDPADPNCDPETLVTTCDPATHCLCRDGATRFTPSYDGDPLNGVSTFDLVRISRHILGVEPFSSPYQYLAGDANGSGTVTSFDVVVLRKLILGITDTLPGNASWRFVPKLHSFPANPLSAATPGADTVIGLAPPDRVAFVGVKIGDIDGSATTGCPDSVLVRSALPLVAPARAVRAGETFELPVWPADSFRAVAWQMALRCDAGALELLGVEPGPYDGLAAHAERGEIRLLWFDEATGRSRTFQPGIPVATLRLRARRDLVDPAAHIRIDEAALPGRAFAENERTSGFQWAAEPPGTNNDVPTRLSLDPNPAASDARLTVSGFGPGILELYAASGVRVMRRFIRTEAGTSTTPLPELARLPAGLYTWHYRDDRGRTAAGRWVRHD